MFYERYTGTAGDRESVPASAEKEATEEEANGNLQYCGRFGKSSGSGGTKHDRPLFEEIRAYPALKGWRWPERFGQVARKSLGVHAGKWRQGEIPTKEERQQVIEGLIKSGEYPDTFEPYWCAGSHSGDWRQGVRFSRQSFEGATRTNIERNIVKDSSPGYPYAKLGTTNGKVMENFGDFIWDLVSERLNLMQKYADIYKTLGPVDLIRYGLSDPVKVFVKDEPHKMEKIRSGKVRIISSVSLVDQIIERLLHGVQNVNEIDMWPDCPSKPGLGLHDDGMKAITQNLKDLLALRGEVMCTDVSGWDWSCQEWELEDDMECRIRLSGAPSDGLFAMLCRFNAHVVARSVYVDPDGFMWAQVNPGVQNSGRYCTSSSNSRMRVLLTLMARLKSGMDPLVDGKCGIIAMGDDSVEVALPGILECMVELGHTIKMTEFSKTIEGVEFCSQVFNEQGLGYPSSPAKTVYRFLSRDRKSVV